ncbi:hypothetical protein DSI31_16885, partial [Mycobacterium tuberculosis]|uniref:hypothetical protein n=2 Tax=cellular organisms TaxID=131567 RepID=UPI000E3825E8
RDWYWKDKAEKERTAATQSHTAQDPDELVRRVNESATPKLWGADWHWSIQLLVWLCIAVLLLIAWRLVR